jgi:hypothetical protein
MSHVDDGSLHAYIDGELSPTETQGVAAHVAQCPTCRERLEEARALIARAEALLAIAAPPLSERETPPFRAGDVERPPRRLWWRVRLPVAWAATVALALGIGAYLGGGLISGRSSGMAVATDTTTPRVLPAPVTKDLVQQHEPRVTGNRAAQSSPGARIAAPAPAPQALVGMGRRQDQPRDEIAAQPDSVAGERRPDGARLGSKMARLEAAADMPYTWQKQSPITLDSARRVLGTDPRVVPGLPIEAIYPGRAIGYSGLVLIEQVLNGSTMIEVITGRGTAPTAAAPVAATLDRAVPSLYVEIRGPLSADSLAALRRLLQPLRP